jgi:hypothetical protein
MTESNSPLGTGAFGPEPEHDARLGALLRDTVGPTPYGAVHWTALAARIGSAVALQKPTPWWSYAASWDRRAIPMSLAAGIAAAFALWTTEVAPPVQLTTAADVVTAVIGGTPAEDAAASFAHAVTGTADFNVGVPE